MRGNLGLERKVVEHRTVVGNVLEVATVLDDTVAVTGVHVLLTAKVREAPLLRHNDLLATGELVTRTTERLNGHRTVRVLRADRQDDLTDVDTSNKTVRLTVGTTHTSLETVRTSARKHLVDTDDVVRVATNTEVERVLTRHLHHVLVGADTRSLKSFRRDLLVLITHQVDTEREFVHRSLLTTEVVDADLRVRHTTVVPRLGLSVSMLQKARYARKACSCSNGSNEQDGDPSVTVSSTTRQCHVQCPTLRGKETVWRIQPLDI